MSNGALVRITHIGPGLHGIAPTGGVLATVGRVGVVYRDSKALREPGRVEVLFPDGQRYVFAVKELEPLRVPAGWEVV